MTKPWEWDMFLAAPQGLPVMSAEKVHQLEREMGVEIDYRPNVPADETFKFTLNYDYDSCKKDGSCADAFAIYTDASFTNAARAQIVSTTQYDSGSPKTSVHIIPGSAYGALDLSETDDVDTLQDSLNETMISQENRWGLAESYFIVQRLDENGDVLKTPKVVYFTIKPDKKMLAATDVSADIDENGSVNFSWSPVTGADKYVVVKIERSESLGNLSPRYSVMATTSDTHVNIADYNGETEKFRGYLNDDAMLSSLDSMVTRQNVQFDDYDIKTEDSYYKNNGSPKGTYDPTKNGLKQTSFGVVALNDSGRTSAVHELQGNQLLARIPVGATYYRKTSALQYRDINSLPESGFVTMADGHMAQRAVLFPDGGVTIDTAQVDAYDLVKIQYNLQGTYIIGETQKLIKKGSKSVADIEDMLKKKAASNIAAQPKTGSSSMSYEITQNRTLRLKSLKFEEPSYESNDIKYTDTVEPKINNYPVNGSNELVRFIAANLMADNYTFNISDYYTDSTVTVQDAFYEALSQNPYIDFITPYTGYEVKSDGTMTVGLSIDKQSVIAKREKLRDTVKAIVPKIISSEMTNKQKAAAINAWLIKNAEYDYDALKLIERGEKNDDYSAYYTNFPYAWNALGTTVYSKGVCDSYADAFKAFADEAGLPAIHITGTDKTSGQDHAWNKVQADDGKWRIVDVTWDDTPGGNTKYFWLKDSEANRVEDNYFLVDRYISQYAAK